MPASRPSETPPYIDDAPDHPADGREALESGDQRFAEVVELRRPGELVRDDESLSLVVDRLARESGVDANTWKEARNLLDTLSKHNARHYAHSLRVGIYTHGLVLHEQDEKTDEDNSNLAFAVLAASVHDVGKIGIDNSLLDSTDDFTDSEHENVRRHPAIGAHFLEKIDRDSALVAGLHHKFREDGYGIDLDEATRKYKLDPEAVERIVSMARLVMIADEFDAATTRRHGEDPSADQTITQQRQRLVERFPDDVPRIDWLFAHKL